jgi:hypothetical protein
MSTLVRIPVGHMRFVPTDKQSDEATLVLSPAKMPVEFVLVPNDKGRESLLCHDRINQILSPAIQATCLLKPEHFFFRSRPPLGDGSEGDCPQPLGDLSPYDRRHQLKRHRAAQPHRQIDHSSASLTGETQPRDWTPTPTLPKPNMGNPREHALPTWRTRQLPVQTHPPH